MESGGPLEGGVDVISVEPPGGIWVVWGVGWRREVISLVFVDGLFLLGLRFFNSLSIINARFCTLAAVLAESDDDEEEDAASAVLPTRRRRANAQIKCSLRMNAILLTTTVVADDVYLHSY